MTASPSLSVVVPVYNESGNIKPLFTEIHDVLSTLGRRFEIIYVNDGSSDATLQELLALQGEHAVLRVVDLDGNFGEAAALCAGFNSAAGELVITLDGDGQNDPHDIPRLLTALEHGGYRVVSGWRQRRQEDVLLRVLPSRLANALIRWVTGVPLHDNGCGLKIYRRTLVDGAALPRGFNRFMPAVFGVTAAEVCELPVGDRRRERGQSHYGLSRTFAVVRDVWTLPFVIHGARGGERASVVVAIAATLYALARAHIWAGGAVAAIAAMLAWNLRRYNRAQRYGVYRVRREYPERANAT